MTDALTYVASDNAVTRRERRRQSDYRQQVLGLPPGTGAGRTLGNYLPVTEPDANFLSREAAEYARVRIPVVQAEGGQLETVRLRTNMLSSMPLCFNVFGHLRAHQPDAAQLMSDLLGREITGFDHVGVGSRVIGGIECEWAPDRSEHLDDGSAFDAVLAARLPDGGSLLVAVEVKYVDSFSRDPEDLRKDAKYRTLCERFGMADGAFDRLGGHATRQLLRNVLLAESVRRGGKVGRRTFEDAVTVVLARDDDAAARHAVQAVAADRGDMPTGVVFTGHAELAAAAADVRGLSVWAETFRRRYVQDSLHDLPL